MTLIDCKFAMAGIKAFHQGLGISDNSYVQGHSEPFSEANKWQAGYDLARLRSTEAVSDKISLLLAEALWLSCDSQEHTEIIAKSLRDLGAGK